MLRGYSGIRGSIYFVTQRKEKVPMKILLLSVLSAISSGTLGFGSLDQVAKLCTGRVNGSSEVESLFVHRETYLDGTLVRTSLGSLRVDGHSGGMECLHAHRINPENIPVGQYQNDCFFAIVDLANKWAEVTHLPTGTTERYQKLTCYERD